MPNTPTLDAPPIPSLVWFVRLLDSDIQETQLIVRIPGLSEKLGTFVRTSQFTMQISTPIKWDNCPALKANWIEVEPPDVPSPYRSYTFHQSVKEGSSFILTDIKLAITS